MPSGHENEQEPFQEAQEAASHQKSGFYLGNMSHRASPTTRVTPPVIKIPQRTFSSVSNLFCPWPRVKTALGK